jgi:hypothetical protein
MTSTEPPNVEDVAAPLRPALLGALATYQPRWVHLIHIDGWFGPRWLRFSGKSMGALGIHKTRDDDLTLPPFNPGRVLGELRFERESTPGTWTPDLAAPRLHRHQPSSANLTQALSKSITPPALLAWHSRAGDGRATLMAYALLPDGPLCWYLTVADNKQQLVGITPCEIELLQRAAGERE